MRDLPFPDRAEAGRRLGERLAASGLERPSVLAVPRGGILVAAPVAERLDGVLDVIVVRKVGAPHNPELGLGAVGVEGPPVLDERLLERLGVSEEYLAREIEVQREEARRRIMSYRDDDGVTAGVEGGDVIVVDDGIATGGTVTAAASLLRAKAPRRLVLAVPVAPQEAVRRLGDVYDDVVCLHTPDPYLAVGQWYDDFHQVADEEVRETLAASRRG